MVDRLGDMTHYPLLPFTPEPQVATFGDRVWLMRGFEPEAEAYDLEGNVVARVRWDAQAERITQDTVKQFKEGMLQLIGEESHPAYELQRHFYEQDLPIPERLPLYESLVISSDGNLWLERYRFLYLRDETPSQWDVVDPERGLVATVDTPPGFSLYQVRGDSILGLHQDEQGVQRIQVYRVKR
jgi:hypothetical protein